MAQNTLDAPGILQSHSNTATNQQPTPLKSLQSSSLPIVRVTLHQITQARNIGFISLAHNIHPTLPQTILSEPTTVRSSCPNQPFENVNRTQAAPNICAKQDPMPVYWLHLPRPDAISVLARTHASRRSSHSYRSPFVTITQHPAG